jgi:hypothetical protein
MGVKCGQRQGRSGKKLQSYVNRCLRFILGIWWPNVISNEDNQRKRNLEADKIPKIEMDRPYIRAR